MSDENKMVVSIHIPKCAGTTFRHFLATVYGERLWLNYGSVFRREDVPTAVVPGETACIHGHFLAGTFLDQYPDAALVTWVRDPVERVVSNYFHFLRSPDMRDECCRVLLDEKLSLCEFAELDWMRNTMVRYFDGRRCEDFDSIGVAEQFALSLEAMAARMGWEIPECAPPANVNPAKLSETYALSRRDRDYIRHVNRYDAALHEFAVRNLRVPVAA